MAWAPDYCSAAELKAAAGITDTDDDAEIGFAITAASRAIDHHCGRQFGVLTSAAARYYGASWDRERCRYVARIDDLQTTASLVVKTDEDDDGVFETTLTLDTDVRLAPYNAAADGRPWTELVTAAGACLPTRERSIEVTAKWGWTSVPAVVKQAALIQATRIWKRKDSPFGVAGSSDLPGGGEPIRLLSRLDPDVAVLLSGVRRYWGAV